jgi:hypothetical protein
VPGWRDAVSRRAPHHLDADLGKLGDQARRLRLAAGDYYYLLTREHRVDNPPALLRRINTLRRDFFSNKVLYYNFDKYDSSLYVNDAQMNRTRTINGKYGYVLDSKIAFERILPPEALTPENYAWLHAGRLKALSDRWCGTSFDDLTSKLDEHGKLVIKPARGIGGRGIFIIEMQGNSINVNNKIMSLGEARAQLFGLNDYNCHGICAAG